MSLFDIDPKGLTEDPYRMQFDALRTRMYMDFGAFAFRPKSHALISGLTDTGPGPPPSQNLRHPPDLYVDGLEIRFVDWQPDGEVFIFVDEGRKYVSCPKYDRFGYLHPLFLLVPDIDRAPLKVGGYTRMTLGAREAARDRRLQRKRGRVRA